MIAISGDMWYGNAATDIATEEPIVFDSSAFYGHNECASPLANEQAHRILPITEELTNQMM